MQLKVTLIFLISSVQIAFDTAFFHIYTYEQWLVICFHQCSSWDVYQWHFVDCANQYCSFSYFTICRPSISAHSCTIMIKFWQTLTKYRPQSYYAACYVELKLLCHVLESASWSSETSTELPSLNAGIFWNLNLLSPPPSPFKIRITCGTCKYSFHT